MVSDAMRRVAEEMSRKPWSTSVETAFRLVASELEAEALNLDPKPVEVLVEGVGLPKGQRGSYDLLAFYGPDKVRFAPREGYNQQESRYQEWEANRVGLV
ncbi:hypothetical protein SEA_ZOOMAN_290 [Microbacterium phage Zooman]|nr:hypothetical protein SEA_ZOOMAN_290 [Microbacterium phage Zooman]